jgi:hypothetical protein
VTATCLRCDWVGDSASVSCPECGAPLYRAASLERRRRTAARPATPARGAGPEDPPPREGGPLAEDRGPSEPRPVTTSPRSVFAGVGTVLLVILVLLAQGSSGLGPRRVDSSSAPRGGPGGILVYAVADGRGSARLWRWNLVSGEVKRGPLIPAPVEVVNVGSPSFGWLGITSDLGRGVLKASVLDSLEVEAEPERLGRGTIVTWEGETALLVDRGPQRDGCRRTVAVSAAYVDRPGRERILREVFCGDVLSVGRTGVGHFITRLGPGGVDVVGAGYRDAGVLLADHGLIAVSPGGDMIVTPSADLPSTDPAPVDGATRHVSPIRVAGRASLLDQFRGPPVPYLVRGAPLRVDEVLAYGPGASVALVVGRVGDGSPGLWELPLILSGDASIQPRLVGSDGGFTFAAYANDGTAYVATGGSVFILRHHVLEVLDGPEGAPTPAGPLAWIEREPISDL